MGKYSIKSLFTTENKKDILQDTVGVVNSEWEGKDAFRDLLSGQYSLRLHFIGLNEQDILQLMEMKPIVERHIDEIVGAFYEKLQQMPNLMDIINSHSTIERLSATLTQYILDMVSGDIDEQYVAKRKMIGNVHNRIGLLPEWYLGAYTIIQNKLFEVLMRELRSSDDIIPYYTSFQRLCSFDMQIGIETYIESYTASMMKLNEIEELQQQFERG